VIRWGGDAQRVLDAYLERERQERALIAELPVSEGMARRNEFLLQVGVEVGELLHALVLSHPGATVLELGTSYGYSTLFLAHAAKLVGSKVITIELEAGKQSYAREQLQAAGVAEVVDFRRGEVIEIIESLDCKVDLVLIDVWKELYVPCLEALHSKLNHSSIIVADNMLFPPHHAPDVALYRNAVNNHPQLVSSQLLELGSGIEISCFHNKP